MTKNMLPIAALIAGLLMSGGAFAQTAAPAPGTPTAGSPAGGPADDGTNAPKTAGVKPGQTLKNGPNAATGASGSGNGGAGGGVAPGQQ